MIPLEDVIEVLKRHLSTTTLQTVAKDLIAAEKELKAHRGDAGPKSKKRLVAMVRGDAQLKALVAAGAYVVSVPDNDADPSHSTYTGDGLVKRIVAAARAHNDTPQKRRGRNRRLIKTFNDAMTMLRAKTIKQSGSTISIKAKGVPIEVVVVEHELWQQK